MRRFSFEGDSTSTRFGCLLMLPAAVLGTVGLADYAGPQGWRGFAEFLGWWGLCLVVALLLGRLFVSYRKQPAGRMAVAIYIGALAIGFTVFAYVAGTSVFPQAFKDGFTSSLQWMGIAAVFLVVGFLMHAARSRTSA